ncbi:hypothetical protein NQ318_017259 [Aromia moschata]|uniref:Uncharacterized protein n=1 Tax=Aromia moschata TaxID=1265417 RepID=A0AAV8YNR9_9CUCU|nr:hypothetical protein NQ318_017259 [Aromia moschata]
MSAVTNVTFTNVTLLPSLRLFVPINTVFSPRRWILDDKPIGFPLANQWIRSNLSRKSSTNSGRDRSSVSSSGWPSMRSVDSFISLPEVSIDGVDWDKLVPLFLLPYRSSQHESTTYTPSMLTSGREMKLPTDLMLESIEMAIH